MSIFKKIPEIMKELDAVGRNQRNKEQNYSFRGIDDLYNALGPLMAKHGVFTSPTVLSCERKDVVSRGGAKGIHVFMRVQYRFYAEDGSHFDSVVEGEGIDYGDKAANKAESIAHKYALTQVFIVRTKDQEDPDTESPDMGSVPKQTPKPPTKPKVTPNPVSPPSDGPKKTTVTDKQLARLWAIASNARWSNAEVKAYCQKHYNVTSSKDLSWVQYDELCTHIEKNPDQCEEPNGN